MKIQRYHSVGFAVLSSALALLSSNVIAGPSTASSGCVVEYVSDGDCDESNNTDECGFDGGDCCDCTCVSTATFTCGDPDNGGFACLDPSAYCVDDDDVTTLPTTTDFSDSATTSTAGTCLIGFVSDGDCDLANNTEECGYDGGDCCECTCVSTDLFTCGDEDNGGFACLDPSAPCVDDDDFTGLPEDDSYFGYDDDNFSASYMFESCIEHFIGDGDCDSSNNHEECGFDGGDCCECACVSTVEFTCGINGFDCADPTPTCSVPSLVEAGTQTTVEVSANAYDTRPGLAGGDVGCGQDGCGPALTRDGVSDDGESRWSCSQSIVDSGKKCRIDFTFEEPQDIVDVQVAFWKGDDRSRTLEASINGEVVGRFDSEPGSTYTTLGVGITGVHTLTFKTVGLAEDEWISLNEVTFWTSPELQRR